MSSEARNLNYWDPLKHFRVFSNERRIERYKIIYLWKSLHGFVPNLSIRKQVRDPSKLAFPKIHRKEEVARTLLRFSLR